MNIKDHLWMAYTRKKDNSVDSERDKRLFKWAYDRIMALEEALKPFASAKHNKDGSVNVSDLGPDDYIKANKVYHGR